VRIFTTICLETNFQCLNSSVFPDLSEPAICLLNTHSYCSDKVSSFRKILSEKEQQKASRFRFLCDQQSYVITHAMLRSILGKYLELDPSEIEFVLNDFGKPSLRENVKKIHFNLSHRSGMSVLAFSPKGEIGIDIEKMDPTFDFNQIAQTHFSKDENDFINAIPEEVCEKFYLLWTRKEALLKAVGTGIGENLGIEAFRTINHFAPEISFPDTDYYLNTFKFQDNYMITTAGSHQGKYILVRV
jgi:phosphopantetheine--protein transferase-like protein